MYSDRRQSQKEKKPEIIEVVKTIKYEPEPDVETQQKVQKLENTVRSQQKDIDELFKLVGNLREEIENMK